mgnify:FL=1
MNLNQSSPAGSQRNTEFPDPPSSPLPKVAVGLVLLTLLIFFPLLEYTFVNYDDELFTTNNSKVAPGFTWDGVKWAFTSVEIDYWRPLSWLSHMLDFELYGAVGGLHHLTNILIHAAAAVMLLVALHRLTRALWPSAMVAALFAWHPLHVESVAWIAERKDVLCGFFWFFSIWAYARYAEAPQSGRYALVLLGFVLGVMSKPMIVTLPCVLLLLDYWPLNRIKPARLLAWKDPDFRAEWGQAWHLLKEKIPMFAIVLALSLSTMKAQREVGTMAEDIPLFARMLSACMAYLTYLRQTFWPADLCILYPLTPQYEPLRWAVSVLICIVLTVRFLFIGKRFPFVPVGWLWFLGVLVPVIGLIQVGEQSHADRYTYVPLVGVFLMLVWWTVSWTQSRPRLQRHLPTVAVLTLLPCLIVTRMQLKYWEDSVEVFRRAIDVNPNNLTAYNNLAVELMVIGRAGEAIPYLEKAISIERRPSLLWNLGNSYAYIGEYAKAEAVFIEAFQKETQRKTTDMWIVLMKGNIPKEAEGAAAYHKLIAVSQAVRKEYQDAAAELSEVIRLDPMDHGARINKAAYLAAAGEDNSAMLLLRETIGLAPTNAVAHSNLGGLLTKLGRHDEAIIHYKTAIELEPHNPDSRHNYALLLARTHRHTEARTEFEDVLRRKSTHMPAVQQLAWLLATSPECPDASKALYLAKQALSARVTPDTLDVAAAAAAANGDYASAVRLAQQALQMIRTEQHSAKEDEIRARLQLYLGRQKYTQPGLDQRKQP